MVYFFLHHLQVSYTRSAADNFIIYGYAVLIYNGIFFIRGDSNGDSSLDISDAVKTLEILFSSGVGTACEDAIDANDDGLIDIADPVRLLDYLFVGAPEPPAPGAQCGEDETGDALVCLQSICP